MFWFGRVVGMVRADQKARWPKDFFHGKKEKEEVGKKRRKLDLNDGKNFDHDGMVMVFAKKTIVVDGF